MTAVPAVRVVGLGKRFRQRRPIAEVLRAPRGGEFVDALVDVSFEVRPGELFGVLGQNGAGKTTLFKVLATLILPDRGHAEVIGRDVVAAPAAARAALSPVIANERSLNWRLSARENLRLFGALHRLSAAGAAARIDAILEVVGLADVGSRQVGQFSSGMKQRLLIARALLPQPRVLLLDEPTRSLDPVSAQAFRRFLRREIVEGEGCTVLLATHDAEEVRDLCDRVVVLHRGRVRADGSTDEMMTRFGEARYRVWSRAPLPETFRPWIYDNGREGSPAPEVPGWVATELVLPGGPPRAADFLAELHRAGVAVARFEPVELSLADLLRRVAADGGGTDG